MSDGSLPYEIEGSVSFWISRFLSRSLIVIIFIFIYYVISWTISEVIDDWETQIAAQFIFGVITTVFGIFVVAAWLMADLELAISRGSRHGIRSLSTPGTPMPTPSPPSSPKRDLSTKKELSSEDLDLMHSVNIDKGKPF